MQNKQSFTGVTVAALLLLTVTAIPAFAAPSSTPTGGNVDPLFSTLAVGTGSPAGLKIDTAGILSNPSPFKPLTVNDGQGFLVTAGSGTLSVSNGGNVSGSGNLSVGQDATISQDATAFNLNAWSTVQAPYLTGTYHVKGVEIGAYTNGVFYSATINAGSTRDYPGTTLKCPSGQIAVACNFAAYSDVANCGTGTASVQTNNVVPTRILLEPQGGGWGTPKGGGWCNATLKNTGGSQICGVVSLKCWNPNG